MEITFASRLDETKTAVLRCLDDWYVKVTRTDGTEISGYIDAETMLDSEDDDELVLLAELAGIGSDQPRHRIPISTIRTVEVQ